MIKEDREFQSDLGIIKKEQMERATIGDTLITHLNKEFRVIKPNVNDFIELMERRCSILVQKDIGNVLAKTGLGAGCRVVDAGTGAGAIALNFANVVGEKGVPLGNSRRRCRSRPEEYRQLRNKQYCCKKQGYKRRNR